jgi:hypothetical protein
MRRPYLVNFTAIQAEDSLNIRASLSLSSKDRTRLFKSESLLINPSSPIESIGLIKRNQFVIRIIGLNQNEELLFNRDYESDSYGTFSLKIPLRRLDQVHKLQIYETKSHPGLEIHLGSFIPVHINNPKKIIISDFDRTLVDTRYHTAREMYFSLSKPLNFFPPIKQSIDILQEYMNLGYHPFILSASPHFYENALRDWLYQNQIFKGSIFLKDYRKILSWSDSLLTAKDLKTQGFYKLNHLVNILLMTGIPNELILMGDAFESDTMIYLTLAAILLDNQDPWKIWNTIREEEEFKLNNKQNVRFLNKFYQLSTNAKKEKLQNLKIYIRSKDQIEQYQSRNFKFPFLNKNTSLVEYYQA